VDRQRQRIALSIKALTPDPWETVTERYQEGELVQGTVSQVVDFGIFIELEPGIEGLLHNSELISYEQRDELESKDKILVKVIRVEPDRRRIGLSVRQVRPGEWEAWAARQEAAAAEQPLATEDEEEDDFDDDLDFDDDEGDEQEEIEATEEDAAIDDDEASDDEAASDDTGDAAEVDDTDDADEEIAESAEDEGEDPSSEAEAA
jgi:ribosomal protein S1